MDTAAQILLIIVAATLAIFLVALSVSLYYVISVLKDIKRLSSRAESVANVVESAAHAFEKAASPLAFLKLAGTIFNKIRKAKE